MFAAGLIAIAQMVALPGALLLKCFPDRDRSFLVSLIYAFGLSLTANAVLVPVMVLLHCYTAVALWAVIAAEIGLLVFLAVRGNRNWTTATLNVGCYADVFRPGSFLKSTAILFVIGTFLIFLRICYWNWDTVFTYTDDVANWDRWACDWAAGKFPKGIWWYPQGITANWSLAYVLTGSIDVKMFAKFIAPLFPLFILLLFVSLAAKSDRIAHLLGLVATGWLLLHYFGPGFMMTGYMDIPLALFCFLAVYPIYADWITRPAPLAAAAQASGISQTGSLSGSRVAAVSMGDSPSGCDSSNWLALTFASGAMLVKQGAILTFITCIIWVAVDQLRKRKKDGAVIQRPPFMVAVCAVLAVLAWYGYNYMQIHWGFETSNLHGLTDDIHEGRSYMQRLRYAGSLIWHARGISGPMVARVFGVLLLGGFFVKRARPILLWLAVPFLLCWGLWFSYEIRTASIAVPLIGLIAGLVLARTFHLIPWSLPGGAHGLLLSAGLVAGVAVYLRSQAGASTPVGFRWMFPYFKDGWSIGAISLYAPSLACAAVIMLAATVFRLEKSGNIRLWWPPAVAVALLMAIALSYTTYRKETILSDQFSQLRQNGVPALNEKLYQVVAERRIRSFIASGYFPFRMLPSIGSLYRAITCSAPCSIADLRLVPNLLPGTGYILIAESAIDDQSRKALASAPDLQTVFLEHGYRLIEIVGQPPDQ